MPLHIVHHQVMIALRIFTVEFGESADDDVDGAGGAGLREGIADVEEFRDAGGRVGDFGFTAAVLAALSVPSWAGGGAAHQREGLH